MTDKYKNFNSNENIGGETAFNGLNYQINICIYLLIKHFNKINRINLEILNDIEIYLNDGREFSIQVKKEKVTKGKLKEYVKKYCDKSNNIFVVDDYNDDIKRLNRKIEQYNEILKKDEDKKDSTIKSLKSFLKSYGLSEQYEKVLKLEIIKVDSGNIINKLCTDLQLLFNCNLKDATNIYEKLFTNFSYKSEKRYIYDMTEIKELINSTGYKNIELNTLNLENMSNIAREIRHIENEKSNKVYERAMNLYKSGKTEQALDILEKNINILTNDHVFDVVYIFYELGEFEKCDYYITQIGTSLKNDICKSIFLKVFKALCLYKFKKYKESYIFCVDFLLNIKESMDKKEFSYYYDKKYILEHIYSILLYSCFYIRNFEEAYEWNVKSIEDVGENKHNMHIKLLLLKKLNKYKEIDMGYFLKNLSPYISDNNILIEIYMLYINDMLNSYLNYQIFGSKYKKEYELYCDSLRHFIESFNIKMNVFNYEEDSSRFNYYLIANENQLIFDNVIYLKNGEEFFCCTDIIEINLL